MLSNVLRSNIRSVKKFILNHIKSSYLDMILQILLDFIFDPFKCLFDCYEIFGKIKIYPYLHIFDITKNK